MGSQPSNGLNFNRQKVVKTVIFHLQPAKMQIDINRQKVSKYFKSLLLAPEESLNWKN